MTVRPTAEGTAEASASVGGSGEANGWLNATHLTQTPDFIKAVVREVAISVNDPSRVLITNR